MRMFAIRHHVVPAFVFTLLMQASTAVAGAQGLPPLASGAAAPTEVLPVFGQWTGDFSIPAFDGVTDACAIYTGEYVVAGQFEWAAGVPARNVARWTGAAWSEI